MVEEWVLTKRSFNLYTSYVKAHTISHRHKNGYLHWCWFQTHICKVCHKKAPKHLRNLVNTQNLLEGILSKIEACYDISLIKDNMIDE
jgi:hypothetical protein